MSDADLRRTLDRVESLERELQRVKRDLLRRLPEEGEEKDLPSLYGSVEGGDITEEMINEAKESLFRPPKSGS